MNDIQGEYMMKLFDSTIGTLEDALHFSAKRNIVISNNIANVDTPNYKSQDVVFNDVLHNALDRQIQAKRTDSQHLPFSTVAKGYQVITNHNTTYSHNQNNVDMDKEMANLAKNQIYYRSLVDRINGKFNTLQTVVRGGR